MSKVSFDVHLMLCFVGKCRPKILVFDSLTYRPGHRVMDLELKEFYDTTASCVRCGLFALHKVSYSCQNYVIKLSFEKNTQK